MNPNPWMVEFAIRERRAREQRALAREGGGGESATAVARPHLRDQCLRGFGRLLVRVGEWLNERAEVGSTATRPTQFPVKPG